MANINYGHNIGSESLKKKKKLTEEERTARRNIIPTSVFEQ